MNKTGKIKSLKGASGILREAAKQNGTLLLANRNRVYVDRRTRASGRNGKYGTSASLRREISAAGF